VRIWVRQGGRTEPARLAALPASAWKTVTVARSGRYRRLRDVRTQVRQIAIIGIGRDEPTLLITQDLDTSLTVVAGNLYRLFARNLPRYQTATPDRIWRHFLDATGTLHITDTGVTCALNLRSHHPVLIDAGYADLAIPIPWWNGRTLRFRFPPR
jgi:hypothetical protein